MGRRVAMVPLPYVHIYKDRHGKVRRYFRRPGFKRVRLPGEIGSEEFMAAYQFALSGKDAPAKKPISLGKTIPGTINSLAISYYNSPEYANLADTTKGFYRNIIERFREEYGDRSIGKLSRQPIEHILAKKAKTPSAANNWLRVVHMLMQFAIAQELREDDPTLNIKKLKIRSEGFAIWPEAMIEKFRDHYPLSTKPRLALELLVNTIQRRSDIIRMGPQHIRQEVLSIVQQKTGTQVDIPILPDLRVALDAQPIRHLTFLTTDYGKPFTGAGFGNWFRDQCNKAGIKAGHSAHGLRKAGATRLAEAGCTDHEIMAWGGWKTLGEVQRYTKAANRRGLAQRGADKLIARTKIG